MFKVIRRASSRKRQLISMVRAADAANRARRWPEAAEAYRTALDMAPARPELWVQYGHSLKEQGFLREAEAAYLQASRLDPTVADTQLQLGHMMKLQGKTAQAVAAYEAAHRLDPQMEHGRAELASLRAAVPPAVRVAPPHQAVADLLDRYQLGYAFLPLFDAFFYHQANPVVRAAIKAPGRLTCLAHFCQTGLDLVLAINAVDRFDPDFYIETVLGGMPFTPANAYRHWLTVGLQQAAVPNRHRWVQSHLGSVWDLDAMDLAGFAAQTDPLAGQTPWVAMAERFLAEAADPARSITPSAGNAGLLNALATRLETGPEGRDRAFRLRQVIAWHVPGHAGNRLAYARTLLERGSVLEAANSYQVLVQKGASPEAYDGLAQCQDRLGQPGEALATLQRACYAHPGRQTLHARRRDQARRFFEHEWMLAFAAARTGREQDGRERVRQAAAVLCAGHGNAPVPPAPVPPARPIRRIALVSHHPLPQCQFYRIDQTAEFLAARGYTVTYFDLGKGSADFHAALHGLDAVMFCRVPALPDVVDAIQAAHALGLVTFYEIDDLIFGDAYPGSLDSYGGQISPEEHIGLALAAPLFEQAMKLCQFGIASTPNLAQAMRSRVASGTVFIRPNALGARHAAFITRNRADIQRPGTALTLFHGSGTKAHKQDFETLLLPALVSLVRRHADKLSILLMGDFPDSEALQSIAAYTTIVPPVWDLETYWSILACADINVAVLQPSPLTDAKSEIKWLEAAMLGIPSVVSDTATYRAVVQADETGLLCQTPAAWEAALDRLVRNPALRQRIGEHARQHVLATYRPATMADRMDAILHEITPAPDRRPLIVVVNVFYPPQAVGGATRVVHDNVRDLMTQAGDRFQVEVFTSLDGGTPYAIDSIAQDGVRVTRVGTPEDPALEYRSTDAQMGAVFGAFLDRTQPALVHFHCIQRLTASIVAATAERAIPYVITVHDGWWVSEHQFLLDEDGQVQTYDMTRPLDILRDQGPKAYARMVPLRTALQGAKRVLAVSEPFAKIYRDCGVPNVVTIENGISSPGLDRQPGPNGKVRLGFVGGLARHKGYDLVRIAIQARSWRHLTLLLIDHAMESGDVRRAQWGSVPVEFRPKWPQNQVSLLYGQIDVLLAPSLWPESFGLVTREAAASGCWVIASDRGSIGADIEEGRNGLTIDVSSPDGLISALNRIEAAPDQYRTMPDTRPPMRLARDQANEIATLYETLLAEQATGVGLSRSGQQSPGRAEVRSDIGQIDSRDRTKLAV